MNGEKTSKRLDIAITGMACRFPGADNPDDFWENIAQGKTAVTRIPPDRWGPVENYFDADPGARNRTYAGWGGFLTDIDKFDAAFFKMSGVEAQQTDPQQRLLLECCWNALEDAGYTDRDISSRNCGVFIGSVQTDYHLNAIDENIEIKPLSYWGRDSSFQAARVSKFFNLKGPSLTLNTACSSSLVAVAQACQSICANETDMALAGGVYLMMTPVYPVLLCKNRMLSPTGSYKVFEEDADGVIHGEGAGVIVLKPLKTALKHRDNIYGVIKGCRVNHDGSTNRILALSANSQVDLLSTVYREYGIDPGSIGYLEAQGGGSIVGDAKEVEALTEVFGKYTDEKQFCPIGSVKPSLGNLNTAASMASIIKVLLSMKHRRIVPSLPLSAPNRDIDFSKTPFYVNTALSSWKKRSNYPRRAGISSFGMCGTNAHVIIEEPPAETLDSRTDKAPCHLMLLSAHKKVSLDGMFPEMLAWLEKAGDLYAIGHLAYMLQACRNHFTLRWAVVVEDIREFKHALQNPGSAGTTPDLFCNDLRKNKKKTSGPETAEANALLAELAGNGELTSHEYRQRLRRLAGLYVDGADIRWETFYSPLDYPKISMPTYPFARKRYWTDRTLYYNREHATPPEGPGNGAGEADGQVAKGSDAIQSGAAAGATPPPLKQRVVLTLVELLSQILQISKEDIFEDEDISSYGLDSAALVTLSETLSNTYGIQITPATFFELETHTVAALATYLSRGFRPEIDRYYENPSPDRPESEPVPESVRRGRHPEPEPIAVIGMSGRFPGAPDLDALWAHLIAGDDLIGEVPETRWDWRPLADRGIYGRWGGFLADIDKFDAAFFGISPREAEMMDPQHRLFLETVWHAVEDAGYRASDLAGTNTGLFVGVSTNDYLQMAAARSNEPNPYFATGNAHSVLVNRISFMMDLNGPSEPVNTACSSSLLAVQRGMAAIRNHDCDMVIAGGVNLIIDPALTISFSKAGMLSKRGRCMTFDKDADGYVRGEGVAAVLLKPLSRAREAGDHIYAVLRGASVNHSGRSNSFGAPNGRLQAGLLCEAYRRTGIDPSTVNYIETHGTGTSIGDPIEINALKKAFAGMAQDSPDSLPMPAVCGIGSIKTNIGHLEAAAGIAGLIKVVLSLKNGQIPPTINYTALNPYIDLRESPFYVVDKPCSWHPLMGADGRPVPRRAGVSSFGFGGVNVHVVVEEPPPENRETASSDRAPFLFILSAKNKTGLTAYAEKMGAFLLNASDNGDGTRLSNGFDLGDLIYTLQTGREPMAERLAIVAGDAGELVEKLNRFTEGHPGVEGVYTGHTGKAPHSRQSGDKGALGSNETGLRDMDPHELARQWIAGREPDWRSLYPTAGKRHMPLPTYPFAGKRHWIENGPVKDTRPAGPVDDMPRGLTTDTTGDAPLLMNLIPRWRVSPEKGGLPEGQWESHPSLIVFHEACHGFERAVGKGERVCICLGAENARRSEHDWSVDMADAQSLADCLGRVPRFGRVIFLGGLHEKTGDGFNGDVLENRQLLGLTCWFRLVKAMIASGYSQENLTLVTLTQNAVPLLAGEPVDPGAAGLWGFNNTLAREFPSWRVHTVDLGQNELADPSKHESLWRCVSGETALANEGGAAYRNGLRYVREIIPLETAAASPKAPLSTPAFRENGVYIIIGGAGGIGCELSRYLLNTYRASLFLIGRSALDSEKRQILEEMQHQGGAITYIRADVTDPESLGAAFQQVKSSAGGINGVIHSAIVLADQGLRDMTETRFNTALAPKVSGSVNLGRVLEQEAVDWVCFFSSSISFFGSPGQSNYAAGCTFKDACAHALGAAMNRPVKVINWGYWGSVGIVANETDRERLGKRGIFSIEPEEAFHNLERLMALPFAQVGVIKASGQAVSGLGIDTRKQVALCHTRAPSLADRTVDLLPDPTDLLAHLEQEKPAYAALNRFAAEGLLAEMVRFGLFEKMSGRTDITRLAKSLHIIDTYERLFHELLRILEQSDILGIDGSRVRLNVRPRSMQAGSGQYDVQKRGADLSGQYPQISPHVDLLSVCIRNLRNILTGTVRATDVIFPDARLDLVKKVYQGNVVNDFFNIRIADAVETCLENRVSGLKPGEKIRLFEIGAGTGGTSAFIFRRIQKYAPHIEYLYTDISQSFLLYAEKEFEAWSGFLRFKTFNTEQPLEAQGIEYGTQDIVIASNVLHATREINHTLAQAKRLLKRNGLLVLNEISGKQDYITLIFGLLEGWWLHTDEALRETGSPVIRPRTWASVLAAQGFDPVHFIASQAHDMGQQAILAQSDGISEKYGQPRIPGGQPLPVPHDKGAPAPGLNSGDTMTYTTGQILKTLSGLLKMEENEIDPDLPFADYGVDSIMGTNLVEALNQAMGISLKKTALYDCTTITRLSAFITGTFRDILLPETSETRPPDDSPRTDSPRTGSGPIRLTPERGGGPEPPDDTPQDRDIAIIGMSGRFPGSDDLDAFWEHLRLGHDLVGEVPGDRWASERYFDPDPGRTDKTYSKWGGFLSGIAYFDPLFFGISGSEAEHMDPQQRLFLEESWKAVENAGYSSAALDGLRCGVFVGACEGDYASLSKNKTVAQGFWGNAVSVIPARLSYFLNLKGPAIAVDTACSSSLVAVHLACQSLWQDETDLAIAGGVYIGNSPRFHLHGSRAGMLSPDGKCYTFDSRANGFVPGEGVGAVVLKPLGNALRDNDYIHAVIKGTAMNQDGATNGITAPSAVSQTALQQEVYERFHLNPRDFQYVEAHGTGTLLGDPIEIEALNSSFRAYTDEKNFCAIGSVKTNIGHSLFAAGIAGLLKIVMAMRFRQIPKSLNFEKANSNIDFTGSPFYVSTELEAWAVPPGKPRMAAISAFGFSGTNVHMVVQEPPRGTPSGNASQPDLDYPVCISAKTEAALDQKIIDLHTWVDGNRDPSLALADISRSLLMGRTHFRHRLAFTADSVSGLADRLREIMDGKTVPHLVRNIIAKKETPTETQQKFGEFLIDEVRARRGDVPANLQALSGLYCRGVDLNWSDLYKNSACKTIPLPPYPFAREKYWSRQEADPPGPAGLHPLIDKNVSTVKAVKYVKTLQKEAFYLKDHRVGPNCILPAVALLEMARAAGGMAAETHEIGMMKNVLWGHPLAVDGKGKTVQVRLSPRDRCLDFEIQSIEGETRTLHSQGRIVLSDENKSHAVHRADLSEMKQTLKDSGVGPAGLYDRFKAFHLNYGTTFRGISQFWSDGRRALSKIILPDEATAHQGFTLHPSLMDAVLQTAGAVLVNRNTTLYMPFTLKEIAILNPLHSPCYADAILLPSSNREIKRFDIAVYDPDGVLSVRIKDLSVRRIEAIKPEGRSETEGRSEPERRSETADRGIYFKPVWTPRAVDPAPREDMASLLLFDRGEDLCRQLNGRFRTVVLVQPGKAFRKTGPDRYEIAPGEKRDYETLLAALAGEGRHCTHIAHLWNARGMNGEGGETGLLDQCLSTGLYPVFFLARALMRGNLKHRVTLGYVYTLRQDISLPCNGAVSGLIRTIRAENPTYRFRTIRLDKARDAIEGNAAMADILWDELGDENPHANEVMYNDTGRFIRSMAVFEPGNRPGTPIRKGGVYLITGGAGRIGLQFAGHLMERYDARLVLTGRSPLTDDIKKRLAAVGQPGRNLLYLQLDVTDAREVEKAVGIVRDRFGGINGVIHAAGIVRDSLIIKKDPAVFKTVIAPKIYGTLYLDQALRDEPLDFFVMCSSMTSVAGNIGQCDYAAANSFMDHFAAFRNRLARAGERAGNALSLNWPHWLGGGMAMDEASAEYVRRRTGVSSINAAQGIRSCEDGLDAGLDQMACVAGDRRKIVDYFRIETSPPLENNVSPSQGTEPLKKIQEDLIQILSGLLKIKAGMIDIHTHVSEYGVDSIVMMKILNRIELQYDISIDPLAVADHPHIEGLARYLSEKGAVSGGPEPAPQENRTALSPVTLSLDPGMAQGIAVIGMAGRFPGAPTIRHLWENLESGKDLRRRIGSQRFDLDRYYSRDDTDPLKTSAQWACLMDGIEMFDPAFFGIPLENAPCMDPKHRILLELTQELLDHAGYEKASVSNTRTGVIIGASESNYAEKYLHKVNAGQMRYFIVNRIQNMMAARISDFYNLKGSAYTMDTACSSGLVAIHNACRTIQAKEADMVIAGGIELLLDQVPFIAFSKAGVLSAGGKTRVFDERADGFVLGEGAGLVLLKSLKQALEDGDRIYATILGSAVNNDGHTMGLTVPSREAQEAVIREALSRAGISPGVIDLFEAHGTGTLLGDPIEVRAATRVYREYTGKEEFCAIGSVKSNMGHLLRAAGIASFIKVVLSLTHGTIPPTLHCRRPHPRFQFKASPFYPVLEKRQWPRNDGERHAAISSFGFGGTNCHMILKAFEGNEGLAYSPSRSPLPSTRFRHQRFWLDDQYFNNNTSLQLSQEEEFHQQLLIKLNEGRLSVDQALDLVKEA